MADRQISLIDHTDEETASQPSHSPSPPSPPPTSQIDILYENQRGWFIFGIPLFSSKALWNLRVDQSAWVDSNFRPSAVNITNAQVPDPSWVWDWKTWYVDMSRDVDEEGWEYSFWFRLGAAWHGNHPWFHSFVRRRRWLRRRVKRGVDSGGRVREEVVGGDTFSVGTGILRTSTLGTNEMHGEEEEEEIRDIGTLMRVLKTSPIDREKIAALKKFVEDGDEELVYLAEQIPSIMTLLLFQNSRLQLLQNLTTTIAAAQQHRQEHKERGEPENPAEERRIDSLLKAVEAADAECKKLEYWSDIRTLTENGEAGLATDAGSAWDGKGEGLDASGASHL